MKGGGSSASPAAFIAVVALVLLAAAAVRPAHGAVTCADVNSSLRPCVGYLTGEEAAPPAECCAGVKSLRTLPAGTAERRQACECVKQAAARYQGLNADAVRDLPGKCGSPLPFPISLSFDCSSIP
ncbi:hypothetical protein EJB05_09958 [Eragrostis curvula]|uniref:Non-specific lipid-transfer protein n=1 Tax=Eragrostis curvula TaxID=38414 RepID=A0A5J9W6C7_9POAL|nr:hypothetical protein EJB05_09958 [Eragrostis curvula]